MLFGGEEQGLFGSKHHIEQLTPDERSRIQAVINMDMIGCLNASKLSVLIEAGANSRSIMEELKISASIYTTLQVETSLNPFASDHVSFLDASFPAVLTIEGADSSNPHDHTSNDTEDHIHYDLALSILKMNTAVLIQQLEIT